MNIKIDMVALLKLLMIPLFIMGLHTYAHSALLIDKNYKRIQGNACIDIDFLEKFEPNFIPFHNPKVTTVRYKTAEELAEIMAILYGCDILAEESKINPEDEYQDGTVYMIWGWNGLKKGGRRKGLFDTLTSKFLTSITMSFDERVYSTFEETMNSPEMERMLRQYGAEKINIQAFTLSGEDGGLLNLNGNYEYKPVQ